VKNIAQVQNRRGCDTENGRGTNARDRTSYDKRV
jgi:hypothetical protein